MKHISLITKHLLLALVGVYPMLVWAQPGSSDAEGMWLPTQLSAIAPTLERLGFALAVDTIYDESKPTLTNGIVVLDGGSCSASVISQEGLLLTNHHCAYDGIAALSTEERDLLTDGFWAQSKQDELPIPGATAGFLVRIEDVTDRVITGDPMQMQQRVEAIITEAQKGNDYEISIEEVYHGGEYYLYAYEVFTDVRLVGAPDSDIGKHGYDRDNWEWPRHTGDFSLLRVYAGADNRPADYDPANQPYRPAYSFPISTRGVKEQDFTMVIGYPGTTERYLTAAAMDMRVNQTQPDRIAILGAVAEQMKAAMDANDATRIALAGDYSSLMNFYKYMIGANTMLKRYDITGQQREFEKEYQAWANADPELKQRYGLVLDQIRELHEDYGEASRVWDFFLFNLLSSYGGAQASLFTINGLGRLQGALSSGDDGLINQTLAQVKEQAEGHFADFRFELDQQIFLAGLMTYYEQLPASLRVPMVEEMANGTWEAPAVAEVNKKKKKKKKKKVAQPAPNLLTPEARLATWVEMAYQTSLATNSDRLAAFLDNPDPEVLAQDPILSYVNARIEDYQVNVALRRRSFETQIGNLRKTYIQGLREFYGERPFYPDANSTMRISYGIVSTYEPRDGLQSKYYTTAKGIMEKYVPDDPDYDVPAKLRELIAAKDFGQYAQGDELRLCFLSTNDLTGGASGSPVINARGEIIGAAFDGNWESMCGDIKVLPSVNRTIAVDIRYVLFLIDKYAGASHLIEELELVD